MIVLATPTIPVTVILLMTAVGCLGFLLDAWKTIRENRAELAKKDLQIARLTAREDTTVQDNPHLTPELVCEAVRLNGYVPTPDDGFVMFMVEGEKYYIQTERIPYLLIDKSYAIQKDGYDMNLFRKAASEVTSQIIMGKVIISDDELSLRFNLDSFENSYEHLRDALPTYIGIINETQQRFGKRYDELKADRERQEKALLAPLVQGEKAEGKVMS